MLFGHAYRQVGRTASRGMSIKASRCQGWRSATQNLTHLPTRNTPIARMSFHIPTGPGPVVLPLSNWAESHITELFTADEKSFEEAFDGFLTENASITVNGEHISRAQYKKHLQQEKALETGAQVAFTGVVEVPKDPKNPVLVCSSSQGCLSAAVLMLKFCKAGNVGLFLKATVDEKFLVLGAPETSTVTASYNITSVFLPFGGERAAHIQ